jgi:endonuclease III
MAPPPDMHEVVRLLDDAYGRPVWESRYPPLDELIYTVLSQNTTDANTVRSFTTLRERFGSWSAVRDAPVEQIEAAIAHGCLAHTKAPRIKAILEAVGGCGPAAGCGPDGAGGAPDGAPDASEPDHACIESLDDEAAAGYLTGLPGVGPKTAACVLMFSLGRPVMPVDTHVHRVARRLGLIDGKVSAEAAHPLLTAMAGPQNVYAVHVNMVLHGRRVCHARRPACERCPLAGICPSAELL